MAEGIEVISDTGVHQVLLNTFAWWYHRAISGVIPAGASSKTYNFPELVGDAYMFVFSNSSEGLSAVSGSPPVAPLMWYTEDHVNASITIHRDPHSLSGKFTITVYRQGFTL